MKINRITLYLLLVLFILATDLSVLFNVGILRQIFSFCFLFLVPGAILYSLFKIKTTQFFEKISYFVGLSIVFDYFVGFMLNASFGFLNFSAPLSVENLLLPFNAIYMILGFFASKNFSITNFNKKIQFTYHNVLLVLLGIVSLILGILNAIFLNNGGTNLLGLIALIIIGLCILYFTFLKSKISENSLIITIYTISLSLLLMVSLRGWYLSGHDIKQEYFVFSLTKAAHAWNYFSFPDPYNACLSITILPTIVDGFLHINDMYIYKLIYQIIFALCPVVLYLIFKPLTSKQLAFLSTILFISFPLFLNDIVFYNRQELAFLLFALLIHLLLKKNLSERIRVALFCLFSAGLIVSHYSTAYLTLAMFIISYFCFKLFNIIRKVIKQPNINFFHIAFLLIFTLIWNLKVTSSLTGLSSFMINVRNNLNFFFQKTYQSNDINYSLFGSSKKISDSERLNSFIKYSEKIVNISNLPNTYYQGAIDTNYPILVAKTPIIPLTTIGKALQSIHISPFLINDIMRQGIAKLIQIFVILGIFSVIFFKKFTGYSKRNYIILCISTILIIGLTLVVPFATVDYSLLRIFQQYLIILSLPAILGCAFIFQIFGKKLSILITTFITTLIFLSLSGFIPDLLGGYYPQLNLNNYGFYYDAYYTHNTEINSITWLKSNLSDNSVIQSDSFGVTKILAYGGIKAINQIVPSTIRKDSYVYLPFSIAKESILPLFYNGNQLYAIYPTKFLDDNKNLVYNNGGSKIYK